ncbi:hypothetical protein SLEP1_g5016 [Rubroshorea leprosula]|uniref:NB-ARC domain-containing protein n=1 Tax=Rubroshorea leprosula TaxID=152421 RepID=A0AAV5HYP9_9ROSI|nr:hypothetical protein SLEP1_g5016 [Rubroshorea leprosula]
MEFLSVAGGALLTVVFERLFNKLKLSRSLNLQKQVLVKLRNWESLLPKIFALLEDAEEKQIITRTILEAVGGKCVSKDLNLLQQELNSKLSNKKFLLVLDDIWNENYSLWDSLQKPFLAGAAGSKIIITTRNERVVEIMGGMDRVYRLEVLKDEECLSVFAQHALGEDNFDAHPNLKETGEKIVKRCKGLPLVAKTLGGLLRGKLNCSAWERILNNEIWELQESESNILPALRLSYHYLPSYLKPCFAYCALFPKGVRFEKNKLVLLWMAWGILQQQSIEAGHLYFSELVSRAFFQWSNGNESKYVVHDLIHDLAQFVAGESFFNLEHMLEVMKCLRTFIAVGSWLECNIANTMVHDWLPKLRYLKVLSLVGYQIEKLPDSIGDLKGLKYLDLSRTRIESLPESVGFLLQLQTLLLFNCRLFFKFPVAIGNLIDLHHLDIRGTESLKEMPLGICNLKNLLTSSKFIVGKENRLMRLSNLKNLSQLQGNLSILNLQNVLNVQDALVANLQNIDGLNELHLEWTSDSSSSSNEEMQVLNWLKPHSKLRSLTIVSYGGQKFPSWIGDPFFSNLSFLKLKDYLKCSSMGFLSLKELYIRDCNAVVLKSIVDPTSLTKLTIKHISGLSFLPKCFTQSLTALENLEIERCEELTCLWEEGSETVNLARLEKLVIRSCPLPVLLSEKEKGLLPLNLKFLGLYSCEALESLPDLMIMKMDGIGSSSSSSTNMLRLEELELVDCPSLKSISLLTTLKWLRIAKCENLESLPDGIGSSSSNSTNMLRLEVLELDGCPSLKSISLPTTLKRLRIAKCENLESLPDGIGSSSSNSTNMLRLEVLKLDGCPSLKSISLPTTLRQLTKKDLKSLHKLYIMDCPSIDLIPVGNENGGLLFPSNLTELQLDDSTLKFLPLNATGELISTQKLSNPVPEGHLVTVMGWGLHNLTSLQDLFISGTCPPNIVLPSSLTTLLIGLVENLESIPRELFQNLNSLQMLGISFCPKLRSLPKKSLPLSLGCLWIIHCPLLKQQLFEAKGDYWPLTCTIPYVEIDGHQDMDFLGVLGVISLAISGTTRGYVRRWMDGEEYCFKDQSVAYLSIALVLRERLFIDMHN